MAAADDCAVTQRGTRPTLSIARSDGVDPRQLSRHHDEIGVVDRQRFRA